MPGGLSHLVARRAKLTLAGFAIAIAAVTALGVAALWTSDQHRQAADLVSHTQEVRASIANARAALTELLNGLRGYVITGRDDALSPYESGIAALGAEMERLRSLTADNPAQQARIAVLDAALADRLSSARDILAARRGQGFDAAKAIIDSDVPARQMQQLRTLFDSLDETERTLLARRVQQNATRVEWMTWAILATVATMVALLAGLQRQLWRWQKQQDALLRSEERFHLMTQSVVDYAILMLDPEGNVTSWNAGAARIKGYSEDEILGRHFSVFYPQEQRDAGAPARALEVAAREGRWAEEGWRVRKDGSRFWATAVITAVRNEDGSLAGYSKVTRDLTERKRADEALHAEMEETRRMEQQLQELNASLEAQVAHRTSELEHANRYLTDAKMRMQDLSTRLITAHEQERRRISRELHDETGQVLTAIKMRLTAAARIGMSPESITESIAIVDQAIRQIRNLALELRPLALDDLGLAAALETALERQAKAAGWQVSFVIDALLARLPEEIESALFRIGQEALTNAARHAEARHVWMRLEVVDDQVRLSVRDDGKGFDPASLQSAAARRAHLGLVSMSERANLAGGQLDVDSAPGRGTEIRATFALELVATDR